MLHADMSGTHLYFVNCMSRILCFSAIKILSHHFLPSDFQGWHLILVGFIGVELHPESPLVPLLPAAPFPAPSCQTTLATLDSMRVIHVSYCLHLQGLLVFDLSIANFVSHEIAVENLEYGRRTSIVPNTWALRGHNAYYSHCSWCGELCVFDCECTFCCAMSPCHEFTSNDGLLLPKWTLIVHTFVVVCVPHSYADPPSGYALFLLGPISGSIHPSGSWSISAPLNGSASGLLWGCWSCGCTCKLRMLNFAKLEEM